VITARDGWILTSYSYPAFELKQPGATSGVVETDYGYHVIYLNRRIPARHVSLAEAAPQLRAGVFPKYQPQAFLRFCAEATTRHEVVVRPERLR
jgi:peptidyl-prolyl cis-trans isomerase C